MRNYHYKLIGLAPPAEKKRRRWMKLTAICLGVLMGVGPCATQEWFFGGADGKWKECPQFDSSADG